MEESSNGKIILKSEEYVSKKLGRKLVVFIVVTTVLFIAFILSKVMSIGADKLEVISRWVVISGATFTGGNATIAGLSQIANVIKKRNGG